MDDLEGTSYGHYGTGEIVGRMAPTGWWSIERIILSPFSRVVDFLLLDKVWFPSFAGNFQFLVEFSSLFCSSYPFLLLYFFPNSMLFLLSISLPAAGVSDGFCIFSLPTWIQGHASHGFQNSSFQVGIFRGKKSNKGTNFLPQPSKAKALETENQMLKLEVESLLLIIEEMEEDRDMEQRVEDMESEIEELKRAMAEQSKGGG